MNRSRQQPECSSPAAMAILESSVVIRLAGRAIAAIGQASEQSTLLVPVRAARATWQLLPVALKQRALGILLLTAAATYSGLAMWKQDPPGWTWTIVPALAMTIGGLLIAASQDHRQEQR